MPDKIPPAPLEWATARSGERYALLLDGGNELAIVDHCVELLKGENLGHAAHLCLRRGLSDAPDPRHCRFIVRPPSVCNWYRHSSEPWRGWKSGVLCQGNRFCE